MVNRKVELIVATLVILGALALGIAIVLMAGCGVVDEMIASRGGDVRSADERAEDLGVSPDDPAAKGAPEHLRETGEFIAEKGKEAPAPIGSVIYGIGVGLTGLGAAWQQYRKRKREVGEQADVADEFKNGLQTMIDFVDALPADVRKKLVPELQTLQERKGTRDTIRAVRGTSA
ncbi:MAG TPA: hypothetical protein VMY35_04415 [Phycisphaerae bacterium]|nr:hypothetical protein [Phycisphaerae bacterium]